MREKILWTVVTTLIFLVCSEIPLYGILKSDSFDPLKPIRAIAACSRGTLMEQGFIPLIVAATLVSLARNGAEHVTEALYMETKSTSYYFYIPDLACIGTWSMIGL